MASFVVTPPPESQTLLFGLYSVDGVGRCPAHARDPYNDSDVSGMYPYDPRRHERLDGYSHRLAID